MAAGTYDLLIEQGATFRQVFRWREPDGTTPKDITGYTARMQVRTKHGAPVLFDLTTENGGLTLNGPAGEITAVITAAASSAVTAKRGVWDLEVVGTSGEVTRLLEGKVTISPEVTA